MGSYEISFFFSVALSGIWLCLKFNGLHRTSSEFSLAGKPLRKFAWMHEVTSNNRNIRSVMRNFLVLTKAREKEQKNHFQRKQSIRCFIVEWVNDYLRRFLLRKRKENVIYMTSLISFSEKRIDFVTIFENQ